MSNASAKSGAGRPPLSRHDNRRSRNRGGNVVLRRGDTTSGLKLCCACRTEKPRDAFYRDKYKKDGLCPKCKVCTSEAKKWLTCPNCEQSKPYEAKNFYQGDVVCKKCREDAGERLCRRCVKVKPFSDFYRKQKGVPSSVCRKCHDTLYARSHGERRLQREFGLSPDVHRQMLKEQRGVCAICKQPETKRMFGKVLAMHVDHCHTSNKVRGLLCADCNLGIGRFKDNPDTLRAAIKYLEKAACPDE